MSDDSSHFLGTIEEIASGAASPVVHELTAHEESDDEEFVYPGVSDGISTETPIESKLPALSVAASPIPVISAAPVPAKRPPSPAQLEALHAAAARGELKRVQTVFRNAIESGDVESFALANDAPSRIGQTALHVASSRGYLDIIKWLVEDCGAMPDIEDREGETALHKAALNGHLHVMRFLLPDRAEVHAQDADGWTALHNACSKGYLDIVRWLCEEGGASAQVDDIRGVNLKSKGGWTPLMNAASKGHLPVVLYLLNKQSADPFVRNNWGETAYDVAAAVFEVWICEVLQKAEADRWQNDAVQYNPLTVHTTVPLVLYENQRLDMRFKTLAVSGGRPKFSASGLGRHGRRSPFELRLPTPDNSSGRKEIAAWRSGLQLPLREDPWTLPKPGSSKDGIERSHFWLSDWTLDITHPGVDADEGWQYAHTFEDSEDSWTSEKPPRLQRLLSGSGAVAAGLGGTRSRSSSATSSGSTSRQDNTNSQTWVRRRRWVRVMRRRLDIPPLPYLQPDGALYHLGVDGSLFPHIGQDDNDFSDSDGQEMGPVPSSGLMSAQDYVARARYLAGSQYSDVESTNGVNSALEARRTIAKLERATTELRQGILGDSDVERKTQAEVLLNAYSRELERRRLAAGAQGLLVANDDDQEFDDYDSDDEFHYPGSEPTSVHRPSSVRSSTTGHLNQFSGTRGLTDLTPHLSQAPEFRVPTHEAPQKVLTPRWTPPTPHQIHAQWERDDTVSQCRECRRRFNFINRRHVSIAAGAGEFSAIAAHHGEHSWILLMWYMIPLSLKLRIPLPSKGVPNGLNNARNTSLERIVIDQGRLTIPSPSSGQSSSQLSDLAECPVCNTNLADIGLPSEQEAHVKNCLEGGSGTTPQTAKYLVYKLPGESALIGIECAICLEEFVKGSTVARLSCLCSFHNGMFTMHPSVLHANNLIP
ncbi:uncharacterized protein FIBRA_07026 [Fibroporia radiculosa]|uniref:Uncharacterized protein n=1 Tax=Fibroporia radiculosa TaxID=599839 RepID=J4GD78_9APHY|nr:uncharacterized protein FIBRA_07026 [Fibroporia radiculosa]CCM04833.1 predicted protein [Fibroporia radiculosa]